MAILKMQGGKLVLKGGKVSCTCCAPAGCCLYSAEGVVLGDITAENLPDSIVVSYDLLTNEIFTKVGSHYEFRAPGYDIDIEARQSLTDGLYYWWFVGVNGTTPINEELGQCLINGTSVADTFPDTLTATQSGNPNVATIHRLSTCNWLGGDWDPGSGEGDASLIFGLFDGVGVPNKWNISDQSGTIWTKDDPQNTPIGTYTNEFSTVTVSE